MSDAILVLNFALCAPNPAKLHTDVGASTRAFSRGRLTAIYLLERAARVSHAEQQLARPFM